MTFDENQTPETSDWSQESGTDTAKEEPQNQPSPQWNDFRSVNNMPETPQKVQRVGTTTLGFTLIAVGVLMICSLLIPNFPIDMVLRFSPLILIFIGGEILYNAFVHRGEKLKYDFLSMFVCFLLIIGSACASVIAPAIKGMVVRDRLEYTLNNDMEEAAYNALQGEKVSSLYVNCYLIDYPWLYGTSEFADDVTWDYREMGDYMMYGDINMTLQENLETPEAFAQKVSEILQKLKPLEFPFYDIHISQRNGYFDIWIGDRWLWDAAPEDLEEYVEYSDEYRYSIGDTGEEEYSDLEITQ